MRWLFTVCASDEAVSSVTSSPSNKKFDGQVGFPTPNAATSDTGCRSCIVTSSEEWFALMMGALEPLTHEWAWYKNGALTETEAAQAWQDIIDAAYDASLVSPCRGTTDVETPFYDDATDVGTNEPADTQTWYGTVTDALAPAAELDFVENLLVWGFTGLLAVGVSPAVAIAFNTVAKKFVIAQRAGDIPEIIRIVVDGVDMPQVDTTGRSGEIIETACVGNPANDTHQIYVVKVS